MPTVRKARRCDCVRIGIHLRQSDRVELTRAGQGGMPWWDVLMHSRDLSSVAWTVLDDEGLPFAMFGVAPDPSVEGAGLVWFLATDELAENQMYVARHSRRYVDEMNEMYPVLHNYVDAENLTSLGWLGWCGFGSLGDVFINGHPFVHIYRSSEQCVTP